MEQMERNNLGNTYSVVPFFDLIGWLRGVKNTPPTTPEAKKLQCCQHFSPPHLLRFVGRNLGASRANLLALEGTCNGTQAPAENYI